jgi:hypothetical protein
VQSNLIRASSSSRGQGGAALAERGTGAARPSDARARRLRLARKIARKRLKSLCR